MPRPVDYTHGFRVKEFRFTYPLQEKERFTLMKLKSTIVALLIGLSLIGAACSKSASSMSAEDKHKLFQAAAMSQDRALMGQVITKLGLGDEQKPNAEGEKFVKEHIEWLAKNTEWVKEYSDKTKAAEYAKKNMP
ncbi:MAG TPA: hypothetical protein VF791_00465 [Pyrinomonadaceae bacterium]